MCARVAGDGLADFEEPPSATLYYLKGVSSWLLIWLVTQFVFALGYTQLEPEELPIGTAFYLCIVTATTVGYGDVGVRDEPSRRIFASIHILYSVSSLAALLNTVQVLHAERKIQLRKAMLLQRQLDQDLIASLDKDNNGLDKLEFVVGMLTKLEILHWDDVEPFLAQFDALDQDRSGRLDKADLMRMVEDRKRKLEAKRTRKLGGAPGAASDATPAQTRMGMDEEMTEVMKLDGSGGAEGGSDSKCPSPSLEYGGVGQRNRELIAAGLDPATNDATAESGLRRQRMLPFMNNVPFLQISQRGGRIRRPRHLRGKISPG